MLQIIDGRRGPFSTAQPGGYGRNAAHNELLVEKEITANADRQALEKDDALAAEYPGASLEELTPVSIEFPHVRYSPASPEANPDAFYADLFGYTEGTLGAKYDPDGKKYITPEDMFEMQKREIEEGIPSLVAVAAEVLLNKRIRELETEMKAQAGRKFHEEEKARLRNAFQPALQKSMAKMTATLWAETLEKAENRSQRWFRLFDRNRDNRLDIAELATHTLIQDDSVNLLRAALDRKLADGQKMDFAQRMALVSFHSQLLEMSSRLDGEITSEEQNAFTMAFHKLPSLMEELVDEALESHNLRRRYTAFTALA